MDNPLILLFGMIAITTLLFALTRSLCRDPDLLHEEVDRERQRALAEAVVRHMDTHELVAIASGRLGAGGLLASRRERSSEGADGEQTSGVSQETRMSFVKMSAGRGGYVPSHEVSAAPPVAILIASSPDQEVKSRQANTSEEPVNAESSALAERSHPVAFTPSSLPEDVRVSSPTSSTRRFRIAGVGAPLGVPTLAGDGGTVYSDNSCSVCLDEYEEGDQLLQLTCGHVFHRPCIDLWLKGHSVCPCCRADLDKLAQVAQVFPTTSRRSLQKALNRADGDAVIAIELLLNRRDSRGVRISGTGFAAADGDRSSDGVRRISPATPPEAVDLCRGVWGAGGGAGSGEGVMGSISSRLRRSGSGMWGSGGGRSLSRSRNSGRGSHATSAVISEAMPQMDWDFAEVAAFHRDDDVELGRGGLQAGEAGAAAGAAAAAAAAAVVADAAGEGATTSRSSPGGSLGGIYGAWAWRRRAAASGATSGTGSMHQEADGTLALSTSATFGGSPVPLREESVGVALDPAAATTVAPTSNTTTTGASGSDVSAGDSSAPAPATTPRPSSLPRISNGSGSSSSRSYSRSGSLPSPTRRSSSLSCVRGFGQSAREGGGRGEEKEEDGDDGAASFAAFYPRFTPQLSASGEKRAESSVCDSVLRAVSPATIPA